MQSNLVLYGIKLVVSGGAAFLAIMLWTKTDDTAWALVLAGTVVACAGVMYELLVVCGIAALGGWQIGGVPVVTTLLAALPFALYIAAFIVKLRSRLP